MIRAWVPREINSNWYKCFESKEKKDFITESDLKMSDYDAVSAMQRQKDCI